MGDEADGKVATGAPSSVPARNQCAPRQPMPSSPPHVAPPFVGRQPECARLRELLVAAREGVGGSVRVVGEAGIGKTRLVEEALAHAGVPVAWGAADEAEQGRPFAAPARALDRPDLHRSSVDPVAVLSGDGLWIGVDRVVDAVERWARDGPAAIVLDDLQWADRGTWLAAAALARRAPAMGLVVIVVHRPLPLAAPLPVPLASIGAELVVPPLDPDQARALAASVVGTEGLGAAAAAEVHRAAGNAFFTIEVARWLRDGGADHDPGAPSTGAAAGALPLDPTLRAAVRGRIDALDPTTVAVLRSVSVLGRHVTVAELCRTTARSPAEVAAAIEGAVHAGLLVDGDGGVAFRHDLVRAAVRAEVPASVVAAHDALLLDGTVVDPWAAQHLAARSRPGDAAASAAVLEAARGPGVAPETVAGLLEEVLRLGPPPGADPATVAAELVVAIACAGDLGAAAARGAELIAAVDDPSGTTAEGDAEAVAALRRMVARLDIARGGTDAAMAGLRPLAAGEGPAALRAEADLHLLEVMTLRRPDAVDDARRVRGETRDPVVRCNAELAVAVHAMRAGRVDESVEAAGAAVAQAALDPMLTAEVHPEVFLANALFYAERYDEAAEAVDHAGRAAARAGVVWPLPHHLAHRAGAALRLGDLDGCRVAAREAAEWSIDTDQRIGATWPHVFTAVVATFTGEVDDARAALALAEADLAAGRWQGTEAVPWAAALVAEADGDAATAAARLAPVVELAAALGWNSRLPLLGPEAARMAWVARDGAAVDRVRAAVEAIAGLPIVEADAARQRCAGFADDDVEALVAAAGLYGQMGSATQGATAWAEAAMVAARLGDHDRAVELLRDEALPRLEALGATGIVARTRATLPVRVARRLGRDRVRPMAGPAALTPAERRVVELVVTGATNGEVAEELVVSRRTVESHLSRIFRKLEVDSRARLIASDPLAGAAAPHEARRV